MTGDELQSAIDAAEDGAVVEVTSDVTLDSTLTVVGKSIVLKSPDGQTNVISSAQGATADMLQLQKFVSGDGTVTNSASLTVTNLVFDGQMQGRRLIYLKADGQKYGTVRLGEGTVVRNFALNMSTGGIVAMNPGTFEMYDGVVVSNIVGHTYSVFANIMGGSFNMYGGLITGCRGLWGTKTGASQDGTVYVYGGTFRMYGGLITGNTSLHSEAGVYAYSGQAHLYGNATVTGNVGAVSNDLGTQYNGKTNDGKGGSITIHEGFCGRATLYTSYVPEENFDDDWTRNVYTDAKAVAGLGGITSQQDPTVMLDGWYSKDKYIYWMALTNREYAANGVPVHDYSEAASMMKGECSLEFLKDMTWGGTGPWKVPSAATKLTMKSFAGCGTRTLKGDDSTRYLLQIGTGATDTNRTLRIENLILQGTPYMSEEKQGCIVYGYGRVELGAGAILEKGGRGVLIETVGSSVLMEDGAVIRDCYVYGAANWGSAVLVGKSNPGTGTRPKFTMNGGLITNCVCECSSAQTAYDGYGGAVYVYTADFEMNGGRIVGNICTNAAAGINNYNGSVTFGGTAVVEGNVGAANDCYLKKTAKFTGDFRGHVGISNPSTGIGDRFNVSPASADTTGAWCFFSSHGNGNNFVGKTQETTDGTLKEIVWAEPTSSFEGQPIAGLEDFKRALPKVISLDEAGRTALPYRIGGTVGGTVALDVTEDDILAAGGSIPVFEALDASGFTGRIVGTLDPELAKKWSLRRIGSQLVLGEKLGLSVLIR